MIPYISIVGFSNSGKTTKISKLVQILTEKGYKVAAVKHAANGYNMDISGKDSFQHYDAGAQQVVIAGPNSITLHKRCDDHPALKDVLELIHNVDLILIEGYKNQPGPKIQIVNYDCTQPELAKPNELVAIISENFFECGVPCYHPAQLEEMADFIVTSLLAENAAQ
jgi:molybdopterin-guanine dinucleotide biosynthesis protein B